MSKLSAAVVLAMVTVLAACSSGGSHGDAAACKAAMAGNYRYALAHPDAPPATEPAACHGVPAPTLSQYATEIMASVTPSPAG